MKRTKRVSLQKQLHVRPGTKEGWNEKTEVVTGTVFSVQFKTHVRFEVYMYLQIIFLGLKEWLVNRCAKSEKEKIQMVTKSRFFGSNVTHVPCGTTKLVTLIDALVSNVVDLNSAAKTIEPKILH